MFESLIVQFVVLWAVIDPIGSIPVYLSKTAALSAQDRRKVASKAILVSTGILLFFLIAGQFLLEAMQIPLSAFQTAGGLVLLLFALTMIFGEGKPDQEMRMDYDINDLAVFPIAVPSIASPGAMMAVVMLTDNHRYAIGEQALTALVMLTVLIITYLLLRSASSIQKVIGRTGASVISRVMGLILAAVAVNNLLIGLRDFFSPLS
ncbi:MAG: MarC family protein [Plesiomonas sp.]|uniref:MarC family protein n=1 Tax=Plesiomonas sp. TaxID=2486279 RepID=UPI003F2B2DB0